MRPPAPHILFSNTYVSFSEPETKKRETQIQSEPTEREGKNAKNPPPLLPLKSIIRKNSAKNRILPICCSLFDEYCIHGYRRTREDSGSTYKYNVDLYKPPTARCESAPKFKNHKKTETPQANKSKINPAKQPNALSRKMPSLYTATLRKCRHPACYRTSFRSGASISRKSSINISITAFLNSSLDRRRRAISS